jgi:hypothetical protein
MSGAVIEREDEGKEDLDYHLLRTSMVIIFLAFGYQKWFEYEAQVLIPHISNGHVLDRSDPGSPAPRGIAPASALGTPNRFLDAARFGDQIKSWNAGAGARGGALS